MSQYPYQPPPNAPYGYGQQDPLARLLAPARRASVFMFIASALFIPCGLILAGASLVDFSQLAQTSPESAAGIKVWESLATKFGWKLSSLFQVVGSMALIPGILLLVGGVTVRRGRFGSVVASIILCCILALPIGLVLLGSLLQAGQMPAEVVMGTCIWGMIFFILAGALVSLFQAARNASTLDQYRQNYQAQAQFYAQNPQAQQQQQPYYPSQQPQVWQQPGPGHWPPPPPPGQQNWPPPTDKQ